MATPASYTLGDRITEFEEAIVEAVAAIDQADGSRVDLQETLDSVREIFENAYGESLTADVNEFLTVNDESEDEE